MVPTQIPAFCFESAGANLVDSATYFVPRDVSSEFGRRLRELRRKRNLSQLRVAVDFGIDRTFISDVENGRRSITLPLLEMIALGMDLSLPELLQDL